MDGSSLPTVNQDPEALKLAARYAPIVMADEREPFSVVAVGYTIFGSEGESPSFLPRRQVEWTAVGYPANHAVEYALWWDWDIGHLYELEHAWTFIGPTGDVVAVEASWHGMFGQLEAGGRPVVEGTHPVLLAQPGKHAMAAELVPFEEIREWAEKETGPDAGKDGILENELFSGALRKTPANDNRVKDYLAKRAFTPAWSFTRRMEIAPEILIPWETLRGWIPARVAWCLEQI